MTERQLQDAVIECARLLGWKVAHFRPAKTEKGWRTPVEADGKGFPDLVMVHQSGHLIFAELKSDKGVMSAEQVDWMRALAEAAISDRVRFFCWRPSHWIAGDIEKALRMT